MRYCRNSLTDCVMSCFCLQVLQYNVEAGTWTQIGTLQMRRAFHAIAEVDLGAVCRPVGNLNPVKIKSSISLTPRSYVVGDPNPIKKGKQNLHCHHHHSITKTIIFEASAPQSIVGGGKIIVSSKTFGFRFRFFKSFFTISR